LLAPAELQDQTSLAEKNGAVCQRAQRFVRRPGRGRLAEPCAASAAALNVASSTFPRSQRVQPMRPHRKTR
jgi:hypothetical protein